LNKSKRIFSVLSVLLALAIVFSFSVNTVQAEAALQTEQDPYNLIPSGKVEIPVIGEEDLKKFDLPDTEAIRFVSNLRAGWNLGNTFDAYNDGNASLGLRLETYWCGAKTTKELFHALKTAGFNLVRIPVSWHNHVTDDQYTIDPDWMARVKEVAQWATDEGLYFIINIHHDNSTSFFYPDDEHAAQSEKYLTAIWKQIAENFADFDDHCILESMNEPRLVGKNNEWNLDSSPSAKKAVQYINQWNQKFIDLIRSTGGYNATRYLAIPGYCASPASVMSELFTIPTDSAENRIIISVHAYTPYSFALNTKSTDSTFDLTESKNKKQEIAGFMNNLYNKFVKRGTPVIIDEFGALQKKAEDLQARVNFAAYYIASASTRGITCCWWDNHVFDGNGERFGIIDRKTIEWKYPDIALAILQNCTYNREQ